MKYKWIMTVLGAIPRHIYEIQMNSVCIGCNPGTFLWKTNEYWLYWERSQDIFMTYKCILTVFGAILRHSHWKQLNTGYISVHNLYCILHANCCPPKCGRPKEMVSYMNLALSSCTASRYHIFLMMSVGFGQTNSWKCPCTQPL